MMMMTMLMIRIEKKNKNIIKLPPQDIFLADRIVMYYQ